MADPDPVFTSRELRIGAAVAILAGIAVATAWIAYGRSFPYSSDARIFLRVATDPFGDGSALAGLRFDTGTGYRYGRILYPFSGWLLAGGRPGFVAYTLPVVYAASVGAAAAFACALCRTAGLKAQRGLWVFSAPSFLLTFPILFSEPMTVAMLLVTYLLVIRGRNAAAIACAAALLLAREAMLIALVPLVWSSFRTGRRSAARWALALLPLAGWWTWVWWRVGVWPPLDPAYGRRGALSWPLGGPITVLGEHVRNPSLFVQAAVVLALTIVLAFVARQRTRSLLASGSVWLAALALCLGPGAWRIPGEAIRLMFPAQALAIIALTSPARSRLRPAPLISP